MIPRELEHRARELATKFPIVAFVGPRQAGKSTLARMAFPDYAYVNLEKPDIRTLAARDPNSFLKAYDEKVIIDEVQQVPELFSYLQAKVDEDGVCGQFVISGSRNFLLMEKISQSLAGRVAILNVLPFSRFELSEAGHAPADLDAWLLAGGYPRIYDKQISPTDYYPFYIQTYLERDVRSIAAVGSIDSFRRFMQLCAGRTGCLLNMAALAADAGIDTRTAKRWMSILQESFIVTLLPPYFKNFSKRLVKSPKLYFCDTGLACSLLGLRSEDDVAFSPYKGALFENLVYNEFAKRNEARGRHENAWFWHETSSNEVDFLFGFEHDLQAVEAKSGQTFTLSWFKSMKVFTELADVGAENRLVVYGGDETLQTSKGKIVSWRDW